MQSSVRTEYNHALDYAILRANELGLPLIVFFGLTGEYPEANLRHYRFLLEGLKEVGLSLEKMGIKMVVWHKSPEQGVVELGKDASIAVVDRGYTSTLRGWRRHAAEHIECSLIQIESDVIVPIEAASFKEEYSAATFRPKMRRIMGEYLRPVDNINPDRPSLDIELMTLDVSDIRGTLKKLNVDRTIERSKKFIGGTSQAKRHLKEFIDNRLDNYPNLRNDPTADQLSNMSPYLHFGQISPLYIALIVRDSASPGKEAYLEELIVRRELSMNFVYHNSHYDSFKGLPEWCRKTLTDHEDDPREYVYDLEELERAETHDPYWNAAQREMVISGKMHGYMRMYWGKKILEWSETPKKAYQHALYLNNKYELDGRDPNGFAGVAWCFGKHDRPWRERSIFGKVRYMNARGLRRKFDADGYVEKIENLE
jgi:deoxyribodipyrimidine photo-lyase